MGELLLSAKNGRASQSGKARHAGYAAIAKRVGFRRGKQAQGPLVKRRCQARETKLDIGIAAHALQYMDFRADLAQLFCVDPLAGAVEILILPVEVCTVLRLHRQISSC